MEKIMGRLIVDEKSVDDLVRRVLNEVQALRGDGLIARILQHENIDSILGWEKLLLDRTNQPFSLVVMGDFKRGKSTLLNALLGKQVVTTNVTPETVTINRICYAEKSSVEAVLTNGMRIHLETNELACEVIESLSRNMPAPIDHIEIREPNELLRNISVTDTPGLSDMLQRFEYQVQEYMAHADAIIYVVSALSPLSESEQYFLSEKLIPKGFNRLFVVVNFADCLDEIEEIEKISHLVLEKARAISPSAVVASVSALNEFIRKTVGKRPNPALQSYLDAAFDRFRNILKNDMLLHKGIIKFERTEWVLQQMLRDIRGRVSEICGMLLRKTEDLSAAETKCQEDLANIHFRLAESKKKLQNFVRNLQSEALEWMTDFLFRMQEELRNSVKCDSQDLQKHLPFYISDMIRLGTMRCIEEHRKKMDEEIKCQISALGYASVLSPIPDFSDINGSLPDVSWTLADTFMFCMDKITDSKIPNLLPCIIAGYIREKKIRQSADTIVDSVLHEYPQIETACLDNIRELYEKMAKQGGERIEKIYRVQIARASESLTEAQEILRSGIVRKEDVEEKLAFAFKILDRAEQIVGNRKKWTSMVKEA